MKEIKTFNIYGIRETSNENYYILTLCAGKGDKREWINIPVKKELVKFSPVDFAYYVKAKPLVEKRVNKEMQVKTNDLPF